MARFDVYLNPDGNGYLLDLQADLLDHLNTRLVAPLMPPSDAPIPARRLNPVFQVGGGKAVMVTQYLAAVPTTGLNEPVASLKRHHVEIVNAVDMLMQGF